MSGQEPQRSVFGKPDQEEIISRLDDVDVDDEGGSFFEGRVDDSGAAQRAFAAGISAFGGIQAVPGSDSDPESTAAPAPPSDTGNTRDSDTPPSEPAAAGVMLPLTDPALRAAFILGGPAAVHGAPR